MVCFEEIEGWIFLIKHLILQKTISSKGVKSMQSKSEIVLKITWVILAAGSAFMFSYITFIHFFLVQDFAKPANKLTFLNFILPTICTVCILVFYSKEILFGYNPKSIKRNIVSLLFFSVLIFVLIATQYKHHDWIFNSSIESAFLPAISTIIILSSFVGIIGNRISFLIK